MEVKYIREVKTPPNQRGKVGETRDLLPHVAEHLVQGGYVELYVKGEESAIDTEDSEGSKVQNEESEA